MNRRAEHAAHTFAAGLAGMAAVLLALVGWQRAAFVCVFIASCEVVMALETQP